MQKNDYKMKGDEERVLVLDEATRVIQVSPVDPLPAQASVLDSNVRKKPHVVVSGLGCHATHAHLQCQDNELPDATNDFLNRIRSEARHRPFVVILVHKLPASIHNS